MSAMSQLVMKIEDAVHDSIVDSVFTGKTKSFEQISAELNCPVEWVEDCYNTVMNEYMDAVDEGLYDF